MIEEFDKEMDALLRQAAQGAVASAANNPKSKIQNPKSPHLDADEISLFAENALPPKLRENAVVHFADCDRCRRILSDLIAETPAEEIVSAGQIEVFAPAIPWYRKLFAFPNLAYTLGALVLVFSGLVAFTVVQSVDKAKNTEVSQISERPIGAPGMSSDGESVIVEKENAGASMSSNSTSSASMSNSASASSLNAAMSNSAMNSAARNVNANPALNKSAAANKSSVSANELPKEQAVPEAVLPQKSVTDLPIQGRVANNLTEERRRVAQKEEDKKAAEITEADKNDAVKSDAEKSAAPQPKPEPSSVSDDAITAGALRAKSKKLSPAPNVETSSIGGKTFKRAGNVWVDAAYNSQPTTSVTRGTKEYKKLDSGLRGIAENLGGTVIIVWKDRAYRIQ